MPRNTWRNFQLVVRRALRQPFSIGVLVAGLGLSALTLWGWPALAAVVVEIVYIAIKLRDDQFIRDSIAENRESQLRADRRDRMFRIEELDVESRVRMKSIVKLQKEISEDIVNSPVDEVTSGLADTVERTEEIVDRGLAMAQKRRELERYLRRTERSAIEARVRALESKLASETDALRKSEIETALSAKRQELEDYHAIQQAAAQVLDQLDAIECSFQGLRARLVRITSTRLDDWVAARDELNTELGTITTSVDAVAQSVEEALSVGGNQQSE